MDRHVESGFHLLTLVNRVLDILVVNFDQEMMDNNAEEEEEKRMIKGCCLLFTE